MHIPISRRITSILACMLLVVSLLPSQGASAAGNDTIYMTPSSKTVAPNTSFTVEVRGVIQQQLYGDRTAVSGTINFPKSLLQVTSVSTTGSSFTWQASATPNNANGTIAFSAQSFYPGVYGNVYLMLITFKSLAVGTATPGFSADTAYSGGYTPTPAGMSATGGTYTITTTCPSGQVGTFPNCTTPPPTCPAGQIGTPPNCTTPGCPSGQVGTPPNCTTPKCPTGQTGTPPNCTTPKPNNPGGSGGSGGSTPVTPSGPTAPEPTVVTPTPLAVDNSNFEIEDATTTRSYKKATLSWTTAIASKAKVEYGSSLKKLDKTSEVTQLPDGTFETVIPDLTPGKQYYFMITATSDLDTTKTSTYSGVFSTKGFPVIVNITENKSPAASAKLKISEQNYSADKSGKATLELASGNYTMVIKTAKGSKTVKLAVANKPVSASGGIPATQKFSFDVPANVAATSTSDGQLPVGLIAGIIGGSILLGGGLLLFLRRRNAQGNEQATVLVDSGYNEQQAAPLPTFPQDQIYNDPAAGFDPNVNYNYADPAAIAEQQPVAQQYPEAPIEQQPADAAYELQQPLPPASNPEQPPTEYAQAPAAYQEQQPVAPAVDTYAAAPVYEQQPAAYVEQPQQIETPTPAPAVDPIAIAPQQVESPAVDPGNSLNINEQPPQDMYEAARKLQQ